jgi:hypothetical protein
MSNYYYRSLRSGGLVKYRPGSEVPNLIKQITFADSPYTAVWGDDLEVDCTGGGVEINLPTAIGNNGREISTTKVDSTGNTVNVNANGAETIWEESTQPIISQWDTFTLKSNGTNISVR